MVDQKFEGDGVVEKKNKLLRTCCLCALLCTTDWVSFVSAGREGMEQPYKKPYMKPYKRMIDISSEKANQTCQPCQRCCSYLP